MVVKSVSLKKNFKPEKSFFQTQNEYKYLSEVSINMRTSIEVYLTLPISLYLIFKIQLTLLCDTL